MCGILGELVLNSNKLMDKNDFLSLLNLSIRRGPDYQNYYSNDQMQLGFNRLAVLDLSENANQPIHSPSGRYTMIYNGEIYNHFELRNKLSRKGKNLKSYGDTATLAACFDEWGIQRTINQLDGMFAIGAWDQYENSLSLRMERRNSCFCQPV